jgi:hypothetical protein
VVAISVLLVRIQISSAPVRDEHYLAYKPAKLTRQVYFAK